MPENQSNKILDEAQCLLHVCKRVGPSVNKLDYRSTAQRLLLVVAPIVTKHCEGTSCTVTIPMFLSGLY